MNIKVNFDGEKAVACPVCYGRGFVPAACSFGTNKFCQEHNIQDLEEIEVEELRKILINDYGAKKFWELIDE